MTPRKVVRMWHKNSKNEWCHAWDVDEGTYQRWKQGDTALPAPAVTLPNGEHPEITSRVVCGTCSTHKLAPTLMRQEVLYIKE